jgi:uncharacterized protein (TIGR02118 family)
LSHQDFLKHWLEVHAPLAHAVPGVRRYVQSHIVEERTRPDIPSTDVEIDGIAELWYDDRDAMERANASPEAKALHARRRLVHRSDQELRDRGKGDHSTRMNTGLSGYFNFKYLEDDLANRSTRFATGCSYWERRDHRIDRRPCHSPLAWDERRSLPM